MPPSKPAMVTWSARAFATPAATVPTADFRDQLDRDQPVRIDVLEVVDQLRQILDRIDVVMRRRRDQSDTGRRVPHPRDHGINLVAGQLSAFAGFGALRHLDLHHVGVDEIFCGDAEPAGGDLLDRRAHRIAVRERLEAVALPRRLRRCWTCRRSGSSQSPAWCGLRARSSQSSSRRVAKRLTMSLAGSTSSSGIGLRFSSSAVLILNSPRSVNSRSDCSLRIFANAL